MAHTPWRDIQLLALFYGVLALSGVDGWAKSDVRPRAAVKAKEKARAKTKAKVGASTKNRRVKRSKRGVRPPPQSRVGPLRNTSCNARRRWSTSAWPMSNIAADDLLKVAQRHGATLPSDATKQADIKQAMRGAVFWWMIRSLTVGGRRHNTAAMRLRGLQTRDGRPLWLVRSGYTAHPARPGSCFRQLIKDGGVRHVLNVYDGKMVTSDLDAAEVQTVEDASGTYVHPTGQGWRSAMRKHWRRWRSATGKRQQKLERQAYVRVRDRAATMVAKLLKRTLLQPNGKAPAGHLLVHCGGGMHRTGMITGILDRCINGTDMARITADYKYHVDWRSDRAPGGFEAQNLDFIRSFPCARLGIPTPNP